MDNKPFFVGYLDMPAVLKKLYWPLAVAVIVVAGVAGYLIAGAQKSTGAATWDTAALTTVTGTLTLTPYPAVHRRTAGSVTESVLLVAHGKHAAADLVADHDGNAVAVAGALIQRGNWRMLEIADGAVTVANGANAADLAAGIKVHDLGAVSVAGEVADSKCYLGVMKPGGGHLHKACAEVCLLGGIPPLLVGAPGVVPLADAPAFASFVAANGAPRFGYLLADADGNAFDAPAVASVAADTVTVSGRLHRRGGLLFIAVDDLRR